jgi:hypothetical protein
MLKKFMIEREIPGVGNLGKSQLGGAAATSNKALRRIPGLQWQHSYVTAGRTFCIYLAESKDLIHRHAEMSGFPATKVTEITTVIDPATERDCEKVLAEMV